MLQCVPNNPPVPEVCADGLDNDCNGVVDNGCGCSHPLCTTGTALVSGCNSCVADICALDPFCCTSSWDAVCVEGVRTVCGSLTCAESTGTCAHPLCEEGPVGTPLASGCDSFQANCAAGVCAADPFCCTTDWDALCVGAVTTVCGNNCTFQ